MTATELSPQSPGIEPAPQLPIDGSANADRPNGVLTGRERIDALDAEITDLVQRRIEVSRQIQAARISDGGRRVDLRRETEIIARYSAALGRPGTAIAMALLELGRGRA
ncbi:MAG TPA: chorismate mutase [Actinocrinis sp.]|nr:chorismate mutase [Actinocrinis sp.]